MGSATTLVLWIACVALAAVGLAGGIGLVRARHRKAPSAGAGVRNPPVVQLLVGLWGMLTILPRLLGAAPAVGLLLTAVGLVPLVIAILLELRARRQPR
ncbi:hypothetical protein AB0M11_39110 [Streptomyces sp. NPDC051987]|uniref:hypothetical protein n=1 Tax=Streptomyces sp. NPDC051987 TaxID=3155808 RepID=UPI003413E5AA